MAQEELVVDIATRLIAPDEDIYVIHPGEDYWLYDEFERTGHVFLDFPGLRLDFDKPPPDDRILRRMIVMSLALSDWLNNDKLGPRPSDDVKDYIGQDYRLRLGRYVGATRRLYFELKPSTIIVAPPYNWYEDVLIGEIVGPPTMLTRRGLYSGEPVPARKVKWLRRKRKSEMSADVRERFGTPNPLMQLERSLRGEILRAGFDQYAYEGEFAARLNTEKDEFNSLDDYNIQTFVNYVTGVLVAYEQGRTTKLSLGEAIQVLRDNPELAPDLKLNINSKGFQRLVDQTVRPIVVAALLSVAMHGDAAPAEPPRITVKNSARAGDDPCRIEVDERVAGALKLMKLDEWQRVCESARDAKRSTGLSTTMSVKQGKRKKP